MTYYKFKRDTTQFQILADHDARTLKWHDVEITNAMAELLGCKLGDGSEHRVFCDAHQLVMRNPPDILLSNFKKPFFDNNGEVYECKVKSLLNKQWQKLCADLGVKTVKHSDWAWEMGWFNGKACSIHRIDGDYYVEPRGGKFDTDDYLEPVDTVAFLRLRADWEEKIAVANAE